MVNLDEKSSFPSWRKLRIRVHDYGIFFRIIYWSSINVDPAQVFEKALSDLGNLERDTPNDDILTLCYGIILVPNFELDSILGTW